ncbi:hypothetical protein NKH36_34190, partial [Mesorhizobium sp. M1312]
MGMRQNAPAGEAISELELVAQQAGATAAFWSNPHCAAQFPFAIPFACARLDSGQTTKSDFQPRSAPYIAISDRLRSSA